MRPGDHASTFGGGPVACAAALATLEVVEPLLDGHVDKVSARLREGLVQLAGRLGPGADVRGLGLWLALELGHGAPVAGEVAAAALARGLVVNPVTATAVRLAPPLVVSEAEVDQAVALLAGAIEELAR
jgi:acetylornithine/succinyldiaminopimelate/putrescine aminotransferase